MFNDVKRCVDARVDFFQQYYSTPQNMKNEVDCFIAELIALGENCSNATEFEERFVSTGLADRFYTILPKCTPRPVKMTKEQKHESRKIAKEIIAGNKGELLKDALTDVADTVRINAECELIKENRERMIEEGTYGDYTRMTNAADGMKRIAGFFVKKLNK
ncbi:MAG: hypothetical protein VB082_07410 [Christensenella sp.]|nr:hypothetical protein [Christensenella sp.]